MRPSKSGAPTWMMRSKRPGRMSAGSSTSLRFVAAITITLLLFAKPSISDSICGEQRQRRSSAKTKGWQGRGPKISAQAVVQRCASVM